MGVQDVRRVRFYVGADDRHGRQVDRSEYLRIMDAFFPGYTVFEAKGCWRESHESAFVIEVLTGVDREYAVTVARELRRVGEQHTVIVTWENVEMYEVAGE